MIELMSVSVIVLSYNVKDLLRACVDSIVKFSEGVDYELIIVDNASTDGSRELLREMQDAGFRTQEGRKLDLKIIFSKENLGYARGNNLGIRQAKGEYILILNPDTLFLENTLLVMKKWMDEHDDVAVSSCQLLDFEYKISPTGGYFPTLPRIFFWAFFLDDLPVITKLVRSYHPHVSSFWGAQRVQNLLGTGRDSGHGRNDGVYAGEFFPDWVTGAFFMVRRKAMDKVGLLDEKMFLYGEELEWCLRFKAAGWKVGYTPITKIVHLERRSSGGLPRNAVLGEFKGLRYIYGKHFAGWQQIILGGLLDLAAALRVFFWLVRLKPEMAKIYLEALLL